MRLGGSFAAAGCRWGLVAALLVGGLVRLAAPVQAATTWQARVGVASADQAIQAHVFLPSLLTIDVGDTITWTFQAGEPHTVTFLSGNPAPSPFSPPSGGPTYDGTGLVNSGLLNNNATFSLTFTVAGTFGYVCLLHPGQTGTVQVNPAGTPYPLTQAQYDQQAAQQTTSLLATGQSLLAQGLQEAQRAGPDHVTAGIGNGTIAIMRFQPSPITVGVGQTVTWDARDPATPHTITFGSFQGNPQQPSGLSGTGQATISSPTQVVNSGFVGAAFPQGPTFRVTFTAAGTYNYVCLLHAELGMVGTVVVSTTPAATPTPVIPEWSPLWLFGSGLAALALLRRRRRGRR